jgi:hypothetical protein
MNINYFICPYCGNNLKLRSSFAHVNQLYAECNLHEDYYVRFWLDSKSMKIVTYAISSELPPPKGGGFEGSLSSPD